MILTSGRGPAGHQATISTRQTCWDAYPSTSRRVLLWECTTRDHVRGTTMRSRRFPPSFVGHRPANHVGVGTLRDRMCKEADVAPRSSHPPSPPKKKYKKVYMVCRPLARKTPAGSRFIVRAALPEARHVSRNVHGRRAVGPQTGHAVANAHGGRVVNQVVTDAALQTRACQKHTRSLGRNTLTQRCREKKCRPHDLTARASTGTRTRAYVELKGS